MPFESKSEEESVDCIHMQSLLLPSKTWNCHFAANIRPLNNVLKFEIAIRPLLCPKNPNLKEIADLKVY